MTRLLWDAARRQQPVVFVVERTSLIREMPRMITKRDGKASCLSFKLVTSINQLFQRISRLLPPVFRCLSYDLHDDIECTTRSLVIEFKRRLLMSVDPFHLPSTSSSLSLSRSLARQRVLMARRCPRAPNLLMGHLSFSLYPAAIGCILF